MKLGRYEVVRELGKGAMGIVYLAKDPLIGRLVALKTIRVAAHADDDEAKEFQQRFIREAQAAGILNHPSIVTVHDIGQDEENGTSFIAMEFVEGNNLKEVLSQGRALSFEQIGDIVAQIGEALDFAHAKGIVHRDVKPANIILIEGNRAKITDFGIAKIASGAVNLTTTGQFLGTPNYMAPEQIKGAPVDGRTDIFALGICLYECLTRRKPFGGDSLTSISYKIVHEPFPPLMEINPQIPEGYEEIVANCLAKDPTKRYQRARDMAVALRAVIRGEKPTRPADPMLAEETVVTRIGIPNLERDKTPTLEVPFPDAVEAPVEEKVGGSTRPAAHAAGAVAAATAAPAVAKAPRQPVGQKFRKTLTNVRALPLWRRRIPPAIFLGIVALLVAGLIGAVATVKGRASVTPVVDTAGEVRRATEKRLREESIALMQQGRAADAHAKLQELRRLAPKSPFVLTNMQRLEAILERQKLSQQQVAQTEAKFQEALTLFNEKKYADATLRLQETLALNANHLQAAELLTRSQAEEQKLLAARTQRRTTQQGTKTAAGPRTDTTATTATTATEAPAPQSSTTQLTTVFIHPFKDGRIAVRVGADIVVNQKLYDEKPARFLRRATKTSRAVSVTSEFPAKNADVQVWVTVPELKIDEHEELKAVRFEPGGSSRLVIRYDPASKKFSYELN
ncbi:MAG TPA: serine/threonine-protein kinase [Thermoanaerobaculia bacterium]|nr:serine/threonine-protein kinase [Thermoanaerobaculia bacterium]